MVMFLARNPQVRDVVVAEVGLKSFTLVDPEFGLEKQVYVDKHGAQGCVPSESAFQHWLFSCFELSWCLGVE